ncbi:MAG: alpha/beta hydrolase [Verrucomicrobiales bacterium]|nr:alpha/beta hydrolase [Verrucomicrobiales bacterium]
MKTNFGIGCVLVGMILPCMAEVDAEASRRAWSSLAKWAKAPQGLLGEQVFAAVALTKEDAGRAADVLAAARTERLKVERAGEMKNKLVEIGGKKMRFEWKRYGSEPAEGRALIFSMHGGGGAPPAVNDSQWKNQIALGEGYQPKNAVYVAPRAPSDSWNLWHEGHIDDFFDRLTENFAALEGIDTDRVYFMGYSAGGDGVYQLAPRMADRLAGAAMSAGHPNEAQPWGLRNIAFALHMGANDGAYKRNDVAAAWGERLKKLKEEDPGGYEHQVELHEGKGHWMGMEDKVAVKWMQGFSRKRFPERVVWFQDDRTHERSYWLAVPEGAAAKGQHVVVRREGQTVVIEKAEGVPTLLVRFNDSMVDMDQPVKVVMGEKVLFEGLVERTAGVVAKTLEERGDRKVVYFGEVGVRL